MKHPFLLAATLAVFLALPVGAQTAPAGWKTQTRDGGATTFTPPDLKAGEIYSVTLYDVAALDGKSLDAYLRAFAGPVGAKAGQLTAPLQVAGSNAQTVALIGAYNSPNGQPLNVLFFGFAVEGGGIRVSRSLFSGEEVLGRYKETQSALIDAMRSAAPTPTQNQPRPAPAGVPAEVFSNMTVGGELVPGVYRGPRVVVGSSGRTEMSVTLYSNGEFRVERDQYSPAEGSFGRVGYNRATGRLNITDAFLLSNDPKRPTDIFCYYGRNKKGEPAIVARWESSGTTFETALFRVGPPQGALPSIEFAAQIRRNAIQTVVAPGRGVPASQIEAVFHDYSASSFTSGGGVYGIGVSGMYGIGSSTYVAPTYTTQIETDEAYLLLRDGTIYCDLRIAPDQFDARASRRKEPEKWGQWKRVGGKIQVSFGGEAFAEVPGERAFPGAPGARLSGRYIATGPDLGADFAVTFTPAGRFQRSSADANPDFTLVKAQKKLAGGAVSGTYSIQGYALTLRYDSGQVARMPFFFGDRERGFLWFEGHRMVLDKAKFK